MFLGIRLLDVLKRVDLGEFEIICKFYKGNHFMKEQNYENVDMYVVTFPYSLFFHINIPKMIENISFISRHLLNTFTCFIIFSLFLWCFVWLFNKVDIK